MSNKAKKQKNKTTQASIMFVCTGNTCRSPMMEFIFREYCKNQKDMIVTVSSSGICATNGQAMSQNAKLALKQVLVADNTVCDCDFRATQFLDSFVKQLDLIVCMTTAHKNAIGKYPNVTLFGDISGGKNVDDPFGKSVDAYIAVAKYFEYSCQDIYEKLKGMVLLGK